MTHDLNEWGVWSRDEAIRIVPSLTGLVHHQKGLEFLMVDDIITHDLHEWSECIRDEAARIVPSLTGLRECIYNNLKLSVIN